MSVLPSRKSLVKVIILGDANAGKTSLLHQFAYKEFVSQKASVCDSFLKREIYINERLVNMQIWDTAGQEKFHSISKSYFRGSDACVIVFDVTNKDSFSSIDKWKQLFIQQTDCKTDFPFILIGNKVDLNHNRVISKEEAMKWCNKNPPAQFFECSAKDATNVELAFQQIAKDAVESNVDEKPITDIPSDFGEAPAMQSKGCCG
jgi:Ras-related protein Rab-7A